MILLVTFIAIWALSPGPVFVMSIHAARKHGAWAGTAVSAGATLTSLFMVMAALAISSTGISDILDSNGMMLLEQLGALGIILVGIYAGYKCLFTHNDKETEQTKSIARAGFVQGMLLMATYIPHALIFYTIVVPQTVEADAISSTIISLGLLKVTLIFGWHTAVAFVSARSRNIVNHNRLGRVLEFTMACVIIGMGVNILI